MEVRREWSEGQAGDACVLMGSVDVNSPRPAGRREYPSRRPGQMNTAGVASRGGSRRAFFWTVVSPMGTERHLETRCRALRAPLLHQARWIIYSTHPGAMLSSLVSSTYSLIHGAMPDPGPEAFDGEAPMNRQVTIYSFDRAAGFLSEVRRSHCEILYRTGYHESAAGALEEARTWMEENDFVLGPYWRESRDESQTPALPLPGLVPCAGSQTGDRPQLVNA
jgi:hypothetical protein